MRRANYAKLLPGLYKFFFEMTLKKNFAKLSFLFGLLLISGCKLSNRDTDFKGRILSRDELFKFGEWHYSSGNVTTYMGAKKINSIAVDTPKDQVNFILADDGNVLFALSSNEHQKGKWSFNSQDSAISITFNKSVDAIDGKLVEVSNTHLVIESFRSLDSIDMENKKISLRQVTTIWYSHH